MKGNQTSLKSWEESYEPPEYSVGDRVTWLKRDSWTDEMVQKVGTVVGVDPECYGYTWKYIILEDGATRLSTVNGEELEPHDDGKPKAVVMEWFARKLRRLL